MKVNHCRCLVLSLLLFGGCCCKAESNQTPDAKPVPPPAPKPAMRPPMPPPPPGRVPGAPGRSSYRWIWRAFSLLSPEEQQKLMQLQRQDPAKFQAIMQEKAEKLYAQRQARRKELDAMGAQYRTSGDPAEKERLKAELRTKLRDDFNRRLQDGRRDLDANRKRLARMEAELKRREENRDAIVDAILENILAGKQPPLPPRK